METNHTPGPWKANLDQFAFTNSGQRAVTTEGGDEDPITHIAFVSPIADRKRNTPYNAPDPVREANARLIASAPELLVALINLRHGSDLPGGPALAAIQAAADAAIAKALGKE